MFSWLVLPDVLYHLPYAAGAYACAEAAAYAFLVIDDIFIGAVLVVFPADSSPVTGSFAHMAVAAGAAGHAGLADLLYGHFALADIVVL
jgi:hypothetical protein